MDPAPGAAAGKEKYIPAQYGRDTGMKAVYQLWGLTGPRRDWDTLLKKIDLIQDRHPGAALVCGLDAPAEVYERIRAAAKAKGSLLYLWLPVFSEWDDLAAFDPLTDRNGRPFLQNADLPGGFRFRCPQSERNRDLFFAESLKRLEAVPFDGVFLDRIRYPSFQFGLEGVLSCFCEKCREKYRSLGFDPDRLAGACEALEERVRRGEDDPLGLTGFDGSRWEMKDPDLKALFDSRCVIITDAIRDLGSRYREKGCRIGLDLFTPALGYFTGQDIKSLAPLADFVKPMLYLHTLAPAGLPYELDVTGSALGSGTKNRLLGLCGADDAGSLAAREIASIRERIPGATVYCGMEINRVRDLAPVGPDEIRRTLGVFRAAGAEGVMPSWSFLSAPDENIEALLDGLNEF